MGWFPDWFWWWIVISLIHGTKMMNVIRVINTLPCITLRRTTYFSNYKWFSFSRENNFFVSCIALSWDYFIAIIISIPTLRLQLCLVPSYSLRRKRKTFPWRVKRQEATISYSRRREGGNEVILLRVISIGNETICFKYGFTKAFIGYLYAVKSCTRSGFVSPTRADIKPAETSYCVILLMWEKWDHVLIFNLDQTGIVEWSCSARVGGVGAQVCWVFSLGCKVLTRGARHGRILREKVKEDSPLAL